MRGKMHRALIRAINNGRLVSVTGDLENQNNSVPRPSASIFFAIISNKHVHLLFDIFEIKTNIDLEA